MFGFLIAWGDGLFMAFQTATIIALILLYQNKVHQTTMFASVYTVIVTLSAFGLIPVSVFWAAQFFNLPIIMLGKN
ncbi:hypothetical protein RUM43_009125 [Polyplax serrata]|uniref:Uncharacterized protein n=1 Tax=Polyplax serrata TaxID=468196 RepID=A0AAN8PHR3_POLSC